MGQKSTSKKVILDDRSGRRFSFDDVWNNMDLFEACLPFFREHYDEVNTFMMDGFLRILDTKNGGQLLKDLMPVFGKNPLLLELFGAFGFIDAEEMVGNKNTKTNNRLFYSATSKDAVKRIEEVLLENQNIYKRLRDKYQLRGVGEKVVCKVLDDAELVVSFVNSELEVKVDDKEQEIMFRNIQTCRLLIRPAVNKQGSDFLSYQVSVAKSGLVSKAEHKGFLFLAPTVGKVDEKELMELVARDKTSEEIKRELEEGAANVVEYLTSGS